MKSLLFLFLIICSVVVASVMHVHKPNTSAQEIGIDKICKGLKGLDSVLPVKTNVGLRLFDLNEEAALWVRYALSYPYAVSDKPGNYDTVINICFVHSSDAVRNIIGSQGRVIWGAYDDEYQYYLTCKH